MIMCLLKLLCWQIEGKLRLETIGEQFAQLTLERSYRNNVEVRNPVSLAPKLRSKNLSMEEILLKQQQQTAKEIPTSSSSQCQSSDLDEEDPKYYFANEQR